MISQGGGVANFPRGQPIKFCPNLHGNVRIWTNTMEACLPSAPPLLGFTKAKHNQSKSKKGLDVANMTNKYIAKTPYSHWALFEMGRIP